MTNDERLTERTIAIIEKGGRILLKRSDGWYLHAHTNIAAGPDYTNYTLYSRNALEMFNLQWAFTIAPLYDCSVVVVYPKKDPLTGSQETIDEFINREFRKARKRTGGMRKSRAHTKLASAIIKEVFNGYSTQELTDRLMAQGFKKDKIKDEIGRLIICGEIHLNVDRRLVEPPFTESQENKDALEKLVKDRKPNIDKATQKLGMKQ